MAKEFVSVAFPYEKNCSTVWAIPSDLQALLISWLFDRLVIDCRCLRGNL